MLKQLQRLGPVQSEMMVGLKCPEDQPPSKMWALSDSRQTHCGAATARRAAWHEHIQRGCSENIQTGDARHRGLGRKHEYH